jgi:hypothetical protein
VRLGSAFDRAGFDAIGAIADAVGGEVLGLEFDQPLAMLFAGNRKGVRNLFWLSTSKRTALTT